MTTNHDRARPGYRLCIHDGAVVALRTIRPLPALRKSNKYYLPATC